MCDVFFMTGKYFFVKVSLKEQHEEHRLLQKLVLGLFKISFRLKIWHVFMWQLLEILDVFNTFFLKQIFWRKTLFRKSEYRFLVESTTLKVQDWKRNISKQIEDSKM